ncbi:MAG: helix-turn-helix domain-containing protein [Pseudomonadota bacterium]
MTVREVADYLKIAEKTAYRLVLDKKIPGFKVGNAWRFRKKEIEDWIVNQTKGSASIKSGGPLDAN